MNKSLEAMNREREQQTETEEQESQDNGWAVWWVLVMFYWDYQNDPMRPRLSSFPSFLFLLFIYF